MQHPAPALLQRRPRRLAPNNNDPLAPTPTTPARAPALASDRLKLALQQRADVVTVRSTIEASATAGAGSSAPVPVGPIVGGVVAGVFIVLLAAGFWWWWVANKPKQRTKPKRSALPSTKPGLVPAPVSYARSRPSTSSAQTGKGHPSSEKVPLSALSPSPSPINKSRSPTAGQRSTSGSSTAPLVPPPSSQTSPTKKTWSPANPSPLASGTPITVPEPPRWGQAPFVPSPALSPGPTYAGGGGSASGHSYGGSEDHGAYSTSPGSTTHLQLPRSASGGFASGGGAIYEDATDDNGAGAAGQRTSNRYSAASDASRYSQVDGPFYAPPSTTAHNGPMMASVDERSAAAYHHQAYSYGEPTEPGRAYGAPPSGAYAYGGGYADGGREEYVDDGPGGRSADAYRLDSYYGGGADRR